MCSVRSVIKPTPLEYGVRRGSAFSRLPGLGWGDKPKHPLQSSTSWRRVHIPQYTESKDWPDSWWRWRGASLVSGVPPACSRVQTSMIRIGRGVGHLFRQYNPPYSHTCTDHHTDSPDPVSVCGSSRSLPLFAHRFPSRCSLAPPTAT